MADRAALDQKTPALLTLLAGVLAIASAFPNWYTLGDSDGSLEFKGIESSAGAGTAGIGMILIITGIVLWVRGARSGGKAASVVTLVFACLALFASGYSVASPGDAIAQFEASDVAETYGLSDDEAQEIIQDAVDSGELEVSAELGAYIALVPSFLGIGAGIMGIKRSTKIKEGGTMVAPAAPSAPPPSS